MSMPTKPINENSVVCVTGASGFAGSTAVDFLLLNGYSVLATDMPGRDFTAAREHERFMSENPKRYRGVSLEIVPADLTKPSDAVALFKGRRVRYLLHPAALFSIGAAKESLWSVNVDGTRNLLDAASEHAPELLGAAIWSASQVYGDASASLMSEDTVPQPSNLYARSKLEEEHVALEFERKGLPVIIIRPANVYGPRNFYRMYRMVRPISLGVAPLPGDGSAKTHLVHIDDVTAAATHLVYVMEHQKLSGKIFNVADDSPDTIKNVMSAVAAELRAPSPSLKLPRAAFKLMSDVLPRGKRVPFFESAPEEFSDLFKDFSLDTSALKKAGYVLKYPDFRVGIKGTLDWYSRNRALPSIWRMTHSDWSGYWSSLRPEERPFADYRLIAASQR